MKLKPIINMHYFKHLFLCFFFVFMGLEAHSQRSFELNLWPQGPRVKSSDATDTAKVYVFQPAKPNGRAILICPGGGYCMLGMGKEGTEDRKRRRLNSSHANISYAGFCLKKKKRHDWYFDIC